MAKRRKKKQSNLDKVIYFLAITIGILLLVMAVVLLKGCGTKGKDEVASEVKTEETAPASDEPEEKEEPVVQPEDTQPEPSSEDENEGDQNDEETPEEETPEEPVEEDPEEDTTPVTETLPAQTFGSWDLSTLSGDSVPYGFDRDKKDSKGAPEGIGFYKARWGQYKVDFISKRTDENVIYLTMDEGFANEQTEQVLNILKEKNVKVTFFCTSDFVNNCPQFIERMINEGHRIGCHSITHRKMPTLDLATQKEEIMDVVNIMKSKYDYDVRLFRFPEGEFSDQSLALVENCGLKSVFWSFAYRDFAAEQPDVQESLQLTLNSIHPGAIYLLHANSSTNLALLPDFIDGVRARGYEFAGVYPVD